MFRVTNSASEDDTHLASAAHGIQMFLNYINSCQWGSSEISAQVKLSYNAHID